MCRCDRLYRCWCRLCRCFCLCRHLRLYRSSCCRLYRCGRLSLLLIRFPFAQNSLKLCSYLLCTDFASGVSLLLWLLLRLLLWFFLRFILCGIHACLTMLWIANNYNTFFLFWCFLCSRLCLFCRCFRFRLLCRCCLLWLFCRCGSLRCFLCCTKILFYHFYGTVIQSTLCYFALNAVCL